MNKLLSIDLYLSWALFILTIATALGLLVYYFIRNNRVCNFRNFICNTMVYRNKHDRAGIEIKEKVYDKVSHDRMLWSFKPLKLKSFYSKEDCLTLTAPFLPTKSEKNVEKV